MEVSLEASDSPAAWCCRRGRPGQDWLIVPTVLQRDLVWPRYLEPQSQSPIWLLDF